MIFVVLWVTSLSMISSRSIHGAARGIISFLLWPLVNKDYECQARVAGSHHRVSAGSETQARPFYSSLTLTLSLNTNEMVQARERS